MNSHIMIAVSECYETWSRCSSWSSGLTGILWLSCPDRCKEQGHHGGSCVLVQASCSITGTAYQCQCY
ncbi:hypothetical protein DPMN_160920 [Dreissena polymorpha]|uniref:Uncharacterized protein n=1 Tax=Dreissena polymorpha TaxID=45954 RepID=A0A9D4ELP8_DREPO|nr:hypothetical protein DPMN_160920 [Dreissena polymorpha]